MNIIELMKIHAADSGFAPAGVTYKPRDDMRLAIPLVEELIRSALIVVATGDVRTLYMAVGRLETAVAQVQ